MKSMSTRLNVGEELKKKENEVQRLREALIVIRDSTYRSALTLRTIAARALEGAHV